MPLFDCGVDNFFDPPGKACDGLKAAARKTADKIEDQQNQQDGAESNPGTAAVAPTAVTVIAASSTEKEDQYDEQK
jgi:hypothetical protein